jgi:hypothetical protein
MENQYLWHSRVLTGKEFNDAIQEIEMGFKK